MSESASLTPTQRQILDLVENNPDLSNADIADQVDKHVALVRDLRAEHTGADEAEDDEGDDGLSEAEGAILEAIARNPDATNADIADEVGTHVAFVRDTRSEYADDIADLDVDVAAPASADDGATASADGDGGLSSEAVVALVVGLLVLIGLAAVAL